MVLEMPTPKTPLQPLFMGDSSDLLIWQDVFLQQRAVFSGPRTLSPPSPALSTILEAREEDEATSTRRRQFSRRLRAMSINLNKEENKVLHSLGCRLKPVLAMDGGSPDPDLPHLDSVKTLRCISDLELDRWLRYYAADDAAHAAPVAPVSAPVSRREKEHALASYIGVSGVEGVGDIEGFTHERGVEH